MDGTGFHFTGDIMNGVKFYSRELIGCVVETISGNPVGILDDLVIDTVGGRIKYLLIKPSNNVIKGADKVDEKGRLVVETNRIRLEKDRIIIN